MVELAELLDLAELTDLVQLAELPELAVLSWPASTGCPRQAVLSSLASAWLAEMSPGVK